MNIITNDRDLCAGALDSLKMVNDPEIGLNVVDLGLIYQLDFDQDGKQIYVLMTLTTQFCPMGESISDAVSNALTNAFPGYKVNVSLTFDPRWSSALISEEGKMFLNK